ncbi:MAG: hypothetical protein II508_04925 [Acholeplasmatales bacterium]|nr:hypothetical protein [Acholeplasmatales bacterium]MBQ4356989.1 hypothetical protein [Acholeplasmatales bacterium]
MEFSGRWIIDKVVSFDDSNRVKYITRKEIEESDDEDLKAYLSFIVDIKEDNAYVLVDSKEALEEAKEEGYTIYLNRYILLESYPIIKREDGYYYQNGLEDDKPNYIKLILNEDNSLDMGQLVLVRM